jgi:hypothetical protein
VTVTVEREGQIVLAKMVANMDAATSRAEIVRQALLPLDYAIPAEPGN